MANTDITRYDLMNDTDSTIPGTMDQHPKGDYVTYDDHNEIVTALQYELDRAKNTISAALDKLNDI